MRSQKKQDHPGKDSWIEDFEFYIVYSSSNVKVGVSNANHIIRLLSDLSQTGLMSQCVLFPMNVALGANGNVFLQLLDSSPYRNAVSLLSSSFFF